MGLKASKIASDAALSSEEVARRHQLSPHEVAGLRCVSHATYAAFAALVYRDAQQPAECPEGWEFFRDCSKLHLDCEGYYAAAFVNHAMKHCVIAQRGTADVLALRAGIWLYFDEPTIQLFLAEQFSRQVRLAIAQMVDAEEWVVSYTGHSLGAMLAACRAVEEDTFAVTFDSPGSGAFLKKTGKWHSDAVDASVIAYLRQPNLLNTLKPHCGYMVMLPSTSPDGSPAAASSTSTPGSATSLMILPPVANSPPELAARSPIMSELPSAAESTKTSSTGTRTVGGSGAAAHPHAAAVPPKTVTPTATTAATGGAAVAVPANVDAPPSRFGATWFRVPLIRPQGYLREYLIGGAGFGIPEIQQYVIKMEPRIREMLERTQQLHSINGIVEYLHRRESGKAKVQEREMVVMRWPKHLMQFIEYDNAVRALEDPDNQHMHVKLAYEEMRKRIFAVAPCPTDTIPLRFIDARSRRLVELWWASDVADRNAVPLTPLEHKALNCIRIEGNCLRVTVLTPFEAKQFLAALARRPRIAQAVDRVRRSSEGPDTTTGVQSKL